MGKHLFFVLLGAGWILLALFLVSGHFYKKLASQAMDSSYISPIGWDQHMELFKGAIQCSLTNEALQERKRFLKEEIFSQLKQKEEKTEGYVYYFDYNSELLSHILEFIKKEKACCPFFKFDLSVLPFEQGIAVQISGTQEAKAMLEDFEANEL